MLLNLPRKAITALDAGDSPLFRYDATAARLRAPPHGRRLAKGKKTDKKMAWAAEAHVARFIAACFAPSAGDGGSTIAFLTKLCYPLQSLESVSYTHLTLPTKA